MNGFTNAILTLLLGWLRTLLNAVWSLFSSDSGSGLLAFLRENWKLIFVVICVGGFIVDRIIYLIRWRPYYVWASRRRQRKRRAEPEQEPMPYGDAYRSAYAPQTHYEPYDEYDSPGFTEGQTTRYERPAAEPFAQGRPNFAPVHPPVAEENPNLFMQEPIPYTRPAPNADRRFAPPAVRPPSPVASGNRPFANDPNAARSSFAPAAPGGVAAYAPQTNPARVAPVAASNAQQLNASEPARLAFQADRDRGAPEPYRPTPPMRRENQSAASIPQNLHFAPTSTFAPLTDFRPVAPEPMADEPRYDDEPTDWPLPPAAAVPDTRTPREVSPRRADRYLEDVRSGFAPQPAPQQLYPPTGVPEQRDPLSPALQQPIHPGLDLETFQQNIGLIGSPAYTGETVEKTAVPYTGFAPFPDAGHMEAAPAKSKGLGALAKKARSFVSGDDERNPLSIRDLQPTVDVKSAFHAPVYPKKKPDNEEE